MPKKVYKKKFVRKPRNKSYRSTWAGSSKGLAKQALKTAKWVATLVNAEYKYFAYDQSGQTFDYNGVVLSLLGPAQGVAVNQREGDSIKMKNLTIRGDIIKGSVNAIVRIIIFRDKDNDIASAANFLQTTASALAPYSYKNENNKFDTNTIYDRTISLTDMYPQHKFDMNFKIPFHVHFTAGTTTVKMNDIKILFISNLSINYPQVVFTSRISYVDN